MVRSVVAQACQWTYKGSIAQRGCPGVRRRTRVSQPRIRCNSERGSRRFYGPLKLRSSVLNLRN